MKWTVFHILSNAYIKFIGESNGDDNGDDNVMKISRLVHLQ